MPSTPVVVLDSTLTNIANAIRSKTGGSATMKPGQMPAQIASIPTGTLGIPREVSAQGVFQMPSQSFSFSLPANTTGIGDHALSYAFYRCTGLTSLDLSSLATAGASTLDSVCEFCENLVSVDLSSLTTVSGSGPLYNSFKDCHNLVSVDLSSLTTVNGSTALANAFQSCPSLTSIDLSSLTTVSGYGALRYIFYICPRLASVDLSSLAVVKGGNVFDTAFASCGSLTSMNFSSLATIDGGYCFQNAFQGSQSLTSVSFPALTANSFGTNTSQFNGMLSGCSNVTVHFPAAIQSTIGSWSSVTSGFGGTNTTVLFDL